MVNVINIMLAHDTSYVKLANKYVLGDSDCFFYQGYTDIVELAQDIFTLDDDDDDYLDSSDDSCDDDVTFDIDHDVATVLVAHYLYLRSGNPQKTYITFNDGCGEITNGLFDSNTDSGKQYCKTRYSSSSRCDCRSRKDWCTVVTTKDLLTKRFLDCDNLVCKQKVGPALKWDINWEMSCARQCVMTPVYPEPPHFTVISCRHWFSHDDQHVKYGNHIGGSGFQVPEHAYSYINTKHSNDYYHPCNLFRHQYCAKSNIHKYIRILD